MHVMNAIDSTIAELGRDVLGWFAGWWRIIRLSALLLVLALSPSSYRRANRLVIAHHIYRDAARNLFWYTVLTTLIGVVLIRIVVVTALSYGLSRYALEMVVRVLVLELIPLTAALFVAVRCTLPDGAQVAALRARGAFAAPGPWGFGVDALLREALPRALAGIFSVLLLAAVNGALTLVLAYLSTYGVSRWGLASYTRTVGQVFDPAVATIFVCKLAFFSLAVSLIPVASALCDRPQAGARTTAELRGLVRMFVVILLIEAASLAGNYA